MPTEFGLTKENFWDEMRAECPEAVEHFCNWIDAYKNEVSWDQLFLPGIKFHDLPIDVQNGIIARFDLEKFSGEKRAAKVISDLPNQTKSLFRELQAVLNRRKRKLN